MYDGIKIWGNDGTHTQLLNNPLLDFTGTYKATGEVVTAADKQLNNQFSRRVAKYKQLEFTVHDSGFFEIKGSIHKYFNGGLHNYNQFDMANAREAVERLAQEFGINPDTATAHNLEIGVNLIIPFNPNRVIDGLVTHKSNPFNRMDVKTGNGRQTIKGTKQYIVKCYNKSAQYSVDANILRFELKHFKMEAISKGETVYLSTLFKPEFIARCQQRIIEVFDELIIKEPVDFQSLTNRQRDLYKDCTNPLYWNTLSNQERWRQNKSYAKLLALKSTDRLKEKTRVILIKTLEQLTEIKPKTVDRLTGVIDDDCRDIDRLSIGLKHLTSSMPVNNCLTCGRSLKGQRKGSKYCSEKVYGKDAKQCRNANSNPRNNFKGKIHQLHTKGLLFDLMPYVKVPSHIHLTLVSNTQFKIRK
jgi:hypothetical protein